LFYVDGSYGHYKQHFFDEALIVVSVQYQALIILAKAVVLMPNLF
jgi:hypothetical protein